MAPREETRPKVLDDASETQIEELERQFDEGDRDEWRELTDSYGWSEEDSNAVWDWFGVDPESQGM